MFGNGFYPKWLLLIFINGGADHHNLPTLSNLLFHEAVDALAHILAHGKGVYGLSAGRQLVYNRNVQIAVYHKSQGAWNGCCGHYKYMGTFSLGAESGTLAHAEAVLLIGYHKT